MCSRANHFALRQLRFVYLQLVRPAGNVRLCAGFPNAVPVVQFTGPRKCPVGRNPRNLKNILLPFSLAIEAIFDNQRSN